MRPLNILVVEDNDDLREALLELLRLEGHIVRGVDCAEAVPEALDAAPLDLMILDLNLPGEDGLTLARRHRILQPQLGIIMVTARATVAARCEGYECGADIYLPKPIAMDELRAAILALSRRILSQRPAQVCILDTRSLQLKPADQPPIDLTAAECLLLSALARAPGQRLEKWQIAEVLTKTADNFSENALEAQLTRLRKKLDQAGLQARSIKAIRNWGYQLSLPVQIE